MSIAAAIPFFALLAAIALLPLLAQHWWERFFPAVAAGLAAVTALTVLLITGSLTPVFQSMHEYVSFIALIGALYVIAGGIHIRLRGKSAPLNNVIFLFVGAVLANLLGTTGASMVLIRPYLRGVKYRVRPFHVLFFIAIVSNVGGALTPIGDPPLFLGYLKGVPFFWTVETLLPMWALALGLLLLIFYLVDLRAYHRLPAGERHRIDDAEETAEISGWHNILFLFVVLGAVFLPEIPFLREGVMIAAAVASYYLTDKAVHTRNEFSFGPVKEVAILFFGIFVTMVPALEWIRENALAFGFLHPTQYYWASGVLSSVLDNAPTYLNFFNASIGAFIPAGTIDSLRHTLSLIASGAQHEPMPEDIAATVRTITWYVPATTAAQALPDERLSVFYLLAAHPVIVQAISIASVFFGANTYIGNGPNLMVKGISEHLGVKCPSFGAYILRFSLPVLLPVFTLIWIVFFR